MSLLEQLVVALRSRDEGKLNELAEHRPEITALVRQGGLSDTDLEDAERNFLIVWLSSPPDHRPMDWEEVARSSRYVFEVRLQQVTMIEHLWTSWEERSIGRELGDALVGFRQQAKWCYHADQFFRGFNPDLRSLLGIHDLDHRDALQTRLDVVAGYGSYVDQLLLSQDCDPAYARLTLTCTSGSPSLRVPDKTVIGVDTIAKAVEFRSGIAHEPAMALVQAISLSLPAHVAVLPTVSVHVEKDAVELRSRGEELSETFPQDAVVGGASR